MLDGELSAVELKMFHSALTHRLLALGTATSRLLMIDGEESSTDSAATCHAAVSICMTWLEGYMVGFNTEPFDIPFSILQVPGVPHSADDLKNFAVDLGGKARARIKSLK